MNYRDTVYKLTAIFPLILLQIKALVGFGDANSIRDIKDILQVICCYLALHASCSKVKRSELSFLIY